MISSLFYVIAFIFHLLSHFDRTRLYVIAFSFYLLSHFDKTVLCVITFSFYLLSHFGKIVLYVITFSFCYLIVINFTASSVLSYCYVTMFRLSREKLRKKKVLCIGFFFFQSHISAKPFRFEVIQNWDDIVDLCAKDRATGHGAETAMIWILIKR